MAKVSLSKAAKDTGVSLPTLSRWRASGKISADKKPGGGYQIDTSEYDRIVELKKASPNIKTEEKPSVKENATPNESRVKQVEIDLLHDRLKDKERIIEDLREDRDDWKKQAQTLLLKDQNMRPVKDESAEDSKKEGKDSMQLLEKWIAVLGLVAIGLFLALTTMKQL